MEKSCLHHDLKVFSRECSNHCSLCVKQLTGTSKHDFLQNNSCINPLLIYKNKSCILQGLQTPPRCAGQKIYQIMNTLTFTKLSGFSSIFFIPRHAHSVKCKHDLTWLYLSATFSESESERRLCPIWSIFVAFFGRLSWCACLIWSIFVAFYIRKWKWDYPNSSIFVASFDIGK